MSDVQTGKGQKRIRGYWVVLVIALLVTIAGLIIWFGAPQGS